MLYLGTVVAEMAKFPPRDDEAEMKPGNYDTIICSHSFADL